MAVRCVVACAVLMSGSEEQCGHMLSLFSVDREALALGIFAYLIPSMVPGMQRL